MMHGVVYLVTRIGRKIFYKAISTKTGGVGGRFGLKCKSFVELIEP